MALSRYMLGRMMRNSMRPSLRIMDNFDKQFARVMDEFMSSPAIPSTSLTKEFNKFFQEPFFSPMLKFMDIEPYREGIRDFQVRMDLGGYQPEEISVKMTGKNEITIEARREEKDEHNGFALQHIVRKFTIPEGHDIKKLTSQLSSDGILYVTAPKIETKQEYKQIPIEHVKDGQAQLEENKKNDN